MSLGPRMNFEKSARRSTREDCGTVLASRSEIRNTDSVWRAALIVLCVIAVGITIAVEIDGLGAGSRAWFGFWDANAATSGHPYTIAIAQPRPGGASANAGLRDGDLIDLRDQSLRSRVAAAYQPMATQPTRLNVRRDGLLVPVTVTGSTSWEGAPAWKLPTQISRPLSGFWFVGCALLIAFRRRSDRDARILALVLLCVTYTVLDPSALVIPNGALSLVFSVVARACEAAAASLLVLLSSHFGSPSKTRTILSRVAYTAIVIGFAGDLAGVIGLATLWIDPVPFIFRISALRGTVDVVVWALVTSCAIAAVTQTTAERRPRTAWLLLPLPVAILTSNAVSTLLIIVKSWFANIAVILLSSVIVLLSAWIVTYALLKRRVLDVEFVLGRTLVVATVSLIVVSAFVLLEWLLGTVLAGVSHATGLVANAGLALVLGLSLNAIHKRVDSFIDAVLFRKRHEDERALLDFSKEAAYVTDPDALLDRTIANIRHHTDAHSAAVLLDGDGAYSAARSFGASLPAISENDAAILALKTWHKPVDPHHYQTDLPGALAVPMIARGRLIGVLQLGERAGGEAYAPDEVEAIAQFAHGVGSALDSLCATNRSSVAALERTLNVISESLVTLARETASLRGELREKAP